MQSSSRQTYEMSARCTPSSSSLSQLMAQEEQGTYICSTYVRSSRIQCHPMYWSCIHYTFIFVYALQYILVEYFVFTIHSTDTIACIERFVWTNMFSMHVLQCLHTTQPTLLGFFVCVKLMQLHKQGNHFFTWSQDYLIYMHSYRCIHHNSYIYIYIYIYHLCSLG